jgi:hypothetical protein
LLQSVKSTKSRYVISSFREFVKLFGTPKRIISDRGKAFDSKAFDSFCRELAITHHLNATAIPRGNGQVQRYNRVLLDALSTMGADKDDNEWDRNLTNIQLGINGALNKAIGVTLCEALMGFGVCSQSLMRGAEAEELEAPAVDVTAIRKRMVERTERSQSVQKERFDQHRREPRKYVEGDLVLIRAACNPATGQSQ